MKISIIVPVFNVSNYIKRSLLSALNQTYSDLEIILINDCTQDNSMEIIDNIILNHPRKNIVLKLSHEKNRGLSAARNTGLNNASGEYVYFLDSDDEIPPNCIENLSKYIDKYPEIELIVGNYSAINFNGTPPQLKSRECYIYDKNGIFRFHKNIYIMAWNKLTKLSFIKKNNLYFKEGLIHEDHLWHFCVATKNKSLAISDYVTYLYYNNSNSIMNNLSFRSITSKVEIIQFESEWIINNNLQNNPAIINYYESSKSNYLASFHDWGLDNKKCYEYYKIMRRQKVNSLFGSLKISISNVKLFFKFFNNLLPEKMGYYYIKTLSLVEKELLKLKNSRVQQ